MASTPTATTDAAPLINDNPAIQAYYQSFESRIGYRLVLGGTRHFGYWERDTHWPLPIGASLRRMEEKLFNKLNLPTGSQVLDAGCGVGHVALYMARRGLRVTAIDIVDHHVAKAKKNVERARLPAGQVTAQKMDYHHLELLRDGSYDGMYTMETLVHATDPEAALAGFYRILKPGGRIVMHEYDYDYKPGEETTLGELATGMAEVNDLAAMPTNQKSRRGYFKELLEQAGFVDVQVHDYSENIRPMLRLFYVMAMIPSWFIRVLRLNKYFVNTLAGTLGFTGRQYWRYVAITATKPGTAMQWTRPN